MCFNIVEHVPFEYHTKKVMNLRLTSHSLWIPFKHHGFKLSFFSQEVSFLHSIDLLQVIIPPTGGIILHIQLIYYFSC
jgi:hypothetical protein